MADYQDDEKMIAFQKNAQLKIAALGSKDAKIRRDAAYYLGEAGVDEAIPDLIRLYENDPVAEVRQAAKYALGMFRAISDALENGQQEKVVELLSAIVEEGKLGKRATSKIPAAVWGLLGFLLVALIVANVAVLLTSGDDAQTPPSGEVVADAATPISRADLVADLRAAYLPIFNDVTTLQSQFQGVLTGGQLDCAVFLNGTQRYNIASQTATDNPDLAEVVTTLNAAQAGVEQATTRYNQVCDGELALEPAELSAILAPLIQARTQLPEAETVLQEAEAALSAAPEAAATDAEPEATSTQSVDFKRHIPTYARIIDDMTAPRGATGLLAQYWQDVVSNGRTGGCEELQPSIPDDVILSLEDGAASVNLGQAVSNINTGLELTRNGWRLFQESCASGTLQQNASTGSMTLNTAKMAFETARNLLNAVRDE